MEYYPRLDLFNKGLDRVYVGDIAGTVGDALAEVDVWSAADGEDRSASWVL